MTFHTGVVHEVAKGFVAFGFVERTKNNVFFAVCIFVVVEDIGIATVLEFEFFFCLGIKVNIIFGHVYIILFLYGKINLIMIKSKYD